MSAIVLHQLAFSQISQGGIPYSFSTAILGDIETIIMEPVNVDSLLAADEEEMEQEEPVPYRFGYAFEVDLGLGNAGTWIKLPNGDRIWRLRILSPGAYSINLNYDDFWLPDGAKFFIYNADATMMIGAFTSVNNKEHGMFSTSPVKGDISILEYYEPAFVQSSGILHISRVVHGYRNPLGPSDGTTLDKASGHQKVQEFGDSDYCEINVNCSQGASWSNEKRGVVMILTSGGTRRCSGSILNNKREDLSPYLLTANHCLGGESTWIIMFNYESPNCSDIDGPTNQTVSGTTLNANNAASDFALLRLSETPPRSYDVRYLGWLALNVAPQSSVGIHHPRGDIKKISFDDDPAISDTWPNTPANSHWEVYFDPDGGTVEHGSSGSPLFHGSNHRVVGQLHGNLDPLFTGSNYCEVPHAWYGKFSMSWNYGSSSSTRLKEWLDPDNTGILALSGMDDPRPYPPTDAYITGNVGGLPTVHWTASPSSISNYKVYRRRTANFPGPWSLIGTTTATQWTDSGITIEDPANSDDFYVYKVTAMGTNGWESESSNQPGTYGKAFCPFCKEGVPADMVSDMPESFFLGFNFPNPFNPVTTIKYDLPENSSVTLKVYNLKGQEIRTLVNGNVGAGYQNVIWDGKDSNGNPVSSGMYIYRLDAISRESDKEFHVARKMVLLR